MAAAAFIPRPRALPYALLQRRNLNAEGPAEQHRPREGNAAARGQRRAQGRGRGGEGTRSVMAAEVTAPFLFSLLLLLFFSRKYIWK